MINLGELKIIARDEWNASKPIFPAEKRKKDYDIDPHKKRIVLHHSGIPAATQFDGAKTIRGIQQHHQRVRGFIDLGYHLIIGPDLSLWEGRPFDTLGAHCAREDDCKTIIFGNKGSFGLCVIGDYDKDLIRPELKKLIEKVIFEIRKYFEIKPDQIFGHWENSLPAPKTCPGKNLAEATGLGERWRKTFGKK